MSSVNKAMLIGLDIDILKDQKKLLEQSLNAINYADDNKIILDKILVSYDSSIDILSAFFSSISIKEIPENFEYDYVHFLVESLGVFPKKIPQDTSVELKKNLYEILDLINKIYIYVLSFLADLRNSKIEGEINSLLQNAKNHTNEIEVLIKKNKILNEDLRNKTIHEIYDEDSTKFRKVAVLYEVAFYILCLFLAFYFFGFSVEIKTALININFAEQFNSSNLPAFYVQKISLLILSTTLAAFLLKRSFMNRRLADEAYRTAKEIDGLPRYMEGMSDEMKEKIRFDLAYKYFGNGIHHESYTGGENLMHENIKANTEFLKAIKGSGSDEESKKDGEK